MDHQNQTPETNQLTPIMWINTITNQQFDMWTLKWYRQLANMEKLLGSFKNNDGLLIKKIYFNDQTVQNLISCVGIKNINARFAIVDNYSRYGIEEDTFTIILYATDTEGRRCSAYHIGKPQYKYNLSTEAAVAAEESKIEDPGYISGILARKWISGWKNILGPGLDPIFSEQLFLTNYGFLNGYNYQMSDFMNALYPPGTNIINYDVDILLATHQHATDDGRIISTFGLVLAGVENDPGIRGVQGQDVNSYYDLSLPSPPNH